MNIGSGSIVGDNLASTLEAQTSAGLKNFVHLFNFLTFELKKTNFCMPRADFHARARHARPGDRVTTR